jgi:hypothetical protein
MLDRPIHGLRAIGLRRMAAYQGGNLGVLRGLRGSIDVKMALKRSLHDLLSSRKPDFKNFVRELA